MSTATFFPYSWHIDKEETEVTAIRVYGVNESNENICIRINDFTPYIYVELPTNISWNNTKVQELGMMIDSAMKDQKPLLKELKYKKRLYGAYVKENMEYEKYPYLLCIFSNRRDVRTFTSKLTRKKITLTLQGIPHYVQLYVHESDADEILQLTCCKNISTADWINFTGKEILGDKKITLCDREYIVSWRNLSPKESNTIAKPKIMSFDIEVNSTNPNAMPKAEKPGDVVFQISCVIFRHGQSPADYEKYLLTLGQPTPNIVGEDVLIYMFETEAELLEGFSHFICEENPNIIVGYNILGFDIPYMIDRAKRCYCFDDFNIQGFHKTAHANERTIKWSSSAYKNQEFQFLDAEGRLFVDLLPLVKRDFKFNNYKLKTISEHFIGETKDPLSAKGIFKCYRIGIKNDDGVYSVRSQKAMAIVGKYCVQDSALVCMLVDKLQTWIGLTEMAKTCNVPIFTLYTQGQQIKVYSQLYKYCMKENIVVEKVKESTYKVTEEERYVGAHVFPPVPGKYKNIIPFDFASLYPTTIMAYNIDYHTWVPDGSDIPDEKCHIMEWEDHIGCVHDPKMIKILELTDYIDKEQSKIKKLREQKNKLTKKCQKDQKEALQSQINNLVNSLKPQIKERSELRKTKPKFPMCAKRSYRFLKEPKGVLPSVIENCLLARKKTRKVDMVNCKNKIKELQLDQDTNGIDHTEEINDLNSLIGVLDKRQLAYKVSANSMYGAMGVRKGYLPFMPGAMCTTFMGRTNIELVAKTIVNEYDGQLIYGDTDSNYIYFPQKENLSSIELWDYAEKVAENVTKLFPPPIQLEFEEAIYQFFFILTKKRYMYREISSREGTVDTKIGKKGVLLARRDNSKFVRDVYEGVITRIADNVSMDDILYWVISEINLLYGRGKKGEDFIITKSVGNCNNCNAELFIDDKNNRKAMVGDYKTPILSPDPEERQKQMQDKGASTAKEFYLLCLPAQVQLAERMKRRGQRVDPGTRLEYVVSNIEKHTAKQYEKAECADYYRKHSTIITIDYHYYLKALATPLDQVLNVAFQNCQGFTQDFVHQHYLRRYKYHHKLLSEIKNLHTSKIEFEE